LQLSLYHARYSALSTPHCAAYKFQGANASAKLHSCFAPRALGQSCWASKHSKTGCLLLCV
jgi:hypothetical protein